MWLSNIYNFIVDVYNDVLIVCSSRQWFGKGWDGGITMWLSNIYNFIVDVYMMY